MNFRKMPCLPALPVVEDQLAFVIPLKTRTSRDQIKYHLHLHLYFAFSMSVLPQFAFSIHTLSILSMTAMG
jgi:hypothetical protein